MDDWQKLQMRLQNREKDREAKKQARLDKLYKKLGMKTSEESRAERQYMEDTAYAAISLETKQKFLDLMWSGKNVGEASKEVGIDSMMGAQIILRNAVGIMPTKATE
jgi:CRISPR/Cas system CMR subunit Cmr6 (Cas7 group RAMP superfamily)